MSTGVKTKILEVRDRLTCIPVLAIQMNAANGLESFYLVLRSGYPQDGTGVVLMKLSDQESHADPYDWNSRTLQKAHLYCQENFNSLNDGDVLDVEYLLGETPEPKISERFEQIES